MATVQFEREIVSFCPNCGTEFSEKQPDKETKSNVIICGDVSDLSGCGFKFLVKSMGFEGRDEAD